MTNDLLQALAFFTLICAAATAACTLLASQSDWEHKKRKFTAKAVSFGVAGLMSQTVSWAILAAVPLA